MKPRTDVRLAPAALSAYLGAVLITGGVADVRAIASLAVFSIAVSAAFRSGIAAVASTALLVSCWTASLNLDARLQGGVGEALASEEEVSFTGTVASEPRPVSPTPFTGEPRWSLTVRLDSIGGRPEGTARAVVSIVGGKPWDGVGRGDTVEGRLRLDETRPGRSVGIAWDPLVTETRPADGTGGWVARLREGVRNAASGLPDHLRGLAVGMTIGDTSAMPPSQAEDMRIAGLTHLTAVSGAQFAFLALAVSWAARASRLRRRLQVAVLGLAIAGFAQLVHPEPSVLRAAIMGGVFALALWCGRPGQALPALSAAVLVLLLADPFLSLSYGFALSVAATAGIVLWSPVVARGLSRLLPAVLARILAVPVAAQVCCAPILVSFASGTGTYSVFANLLALPFAALVTGFGLAAVLVSPLGEPLAVAFAWAAGQAARPVAWAAETAASLPGSWCPWPDGLAGGLLAAAVSLALIAASVSRRVDGWARIAVLLGVLGAVAASPPVQAVLEQAWARAPEDWAIAVCDVGQGDMILIRAGPESAVVVDTGPDGDSALGCLSRHRVTHVPLLVVTHPHGDHDGGLDAVLATVDVGHVWLSEPGFVSPERTLATRSSLDAWVPVSGTRVRVGEAMVTVWHRGSASAETEEEVNDSSLVVFASSGGVSLMSLGDLETRGQSALAAEIRSTPVDVLKVAHHGSADQDHSLIRDLAIEVAVVSVGAGNPYGHPAPSTLDTLSRALILRTDLCGDVDVSFRDHLVVTARCR